MSTLNRIVSSCACTKTISDRPFVHKWDADFVTSIDLSDARPLTELESDVSDEFRAATPGSVNKQNRFKAEVNN